MDAQSKTTGGSDGIVLELPDQSYVYEGIVLVASCGHFQ